MSEELKPCPFCGGSVSIQGGEVYAGIRTAYTIVCVKCDLTMRSYCPDSLVVERRWNARHASEGYALVPIEPTEKMIQAGIRADSDSFPLAHIYKSMIAAAQESDK